jgi:hypothetical protein
MAESVKSAPPRLRADVRAEPNGAPQFRARAQARYGFIYRITVWIVVTTRFRDRVTTSKTTQVVFVGSTMY